MVSGDPPITVTLATRLDAQDDIDDGENSDDSEEDESDGAE